MAATVTVAPAVIGGRCIAWVDGAVGDAVSRGQRLQLVDDQLVDGVQGLTDCTGPRRIAISIGLAGHFPEGEVRVCPSR